MRGVGQRFFYRSRCGGGIYRWFRAHKHNRRFGVKDLTGWSMSSELRYLHELETTPSCCAMGRVVAAWAIIAANLDSGKRLREVWEAAVRDGLNVSYAVFKTYVQRLRKRDERHGHTDLSSYSAKQIIREIRPTVSSTAITADPLRNIREQRAKNSGFEFSPFPRQGLTK